MDISYDSGDDQWGLFTSVDGLADGTPHRVTVRVTGNARGRGSTWDVSSHFSLYTYVLMTKLIDFSDFPDHQFKRHKFKIEHSTMSKK